VCIFTHHGSVSNITDTVVDTQAGSLNQQVRAQGQSVAEAEDICPPAWTSEIKYCISLCVWESCYCVQNQQLDEKRSVRRYSFFRAIFTGSLLAMLNAVD
jgi:hypothetical protein